MFDTKLTFAVCANTPVVRQLGINWLAGCLKAVTVSTGVGVWEGIEEPSVTVESWFDSDDPESATRIRQAFRLYGLYLTFAEQVCGLYTLTQSGFIGADIVNPDSTTPVEVEDRLEHTLKLCDWFDLQVAV